MPPKTTNKGDEVGKGQKGKEKVQDGEGGKKKKLKDTLLTVDPATMAKGSKVEDTIQENKKRDKLAMKVFIGYTQFNIIQHADKLKFGKYNLWEVIKTQIQNILQSFHINSVDCYNLLNFIPLVVDQKILDGCCWTDDKYSKDELPVMKITPDAPTSWSITAAGGQHHLATLKKWIVKKRTS
ncbi:hypothetical protein V8B97DRAFT_1915850 [Scleroderma yunnanense]